MDFSLASYYPILLFIAANIGFAIAALAAAHLIGPRKRTPVKQMTYESGMDPIGDARQRFDVKFYLIAIMFVVFDVELLFLYPWAVVAYQDGGIPALLQWPVFWGVLVFVALLLVAYIDDWRKGVVRWR